MRVRNAWAVDDDVVQNICTAVPWGPVEHTEWPRSGRVCLPFDRSMQSTAPYPPPLVIGPECAWDIRTTWGRHVKKSFLLSSLSAPIS